MNSKVKITICFIIIAICSFIKFTLAQSVNESSKIVNSILDPKISIDSDEFSANWIVSPFEQKVFIENKGQFTGKDNSSAVHIKYGVEDEGTRIYFTPKGLTYRFERVEVVEDHKRNTPALGNEKEEYYKEEEIKINKIVHTVNIEWLNANADPQIIAEDKVIPYFNYINKENPLEKSVYFAPGFKKILYKDLYPGIDIVYTFHKEKGIKYSLIVYPGANTSLIRMKYSGIDKIYKDAEGNLHVATAIGEIIDHAPITYYNSKPTDVISSSFDYEGNMVEFNLSDYDNNKTIVIDPWTVNPLLTVENKVFNMETDASGNIYIYGGGNPNKLHKYSPTGSLIWALSTALGGICFGDLDVDPAGNAYITEGNNSQVAAIAKINNMGILDWLSIPIGTNEYWAIGFNCAYNQLVTGGGMYKAKAWNINTSTGTLGPNNVLPGHDVNGVVTGFEIRALCTAPDNNFYFLTQNEIVAVDRTFALLFRTPHGHPIPYDSPTYATGFAMGINGIKANNCFIYTTDGQTLIQRNIRTGAILNTTTVANGASMGNSGIAIDSCGNVYVGSQGRVNKYDLNLNFISFSAIPSVSGPLAVYDVSIGSGGEILACGESFIASLAMAACNPLPCSSEALTLDFSTSPASCSSNDGTATVIPSGGTAPYSYSWNTSPVQTTATATGLASGTYMVTVTNSIGCLQATGSTIVPNLSGLSASIISSNTTCFGENDGLATVYPVGGTEPYNISWNTNPVQIDDTASNLSAGNYICTITDFEGCTIEDTITITEPAALSVAAINIVDVSCFGYNDGSATVSGSGGTPPYLYTWAPYGGTSATVTGLISGIYTIVIKDARNCSDSIAILISEPSQLNITVAEVDSICPGQSATLVATAQGGTAPYNFEWNPGSMAGNSVIIQPTVSTTYSVVVTDINNCIFTSQPVNVNIYSLPVVSFTTSPKEGCTPLCVSFRNETHNVDTANWELGDGQIASGSGAFHCYHQPGSYSITLGVTDNNGCSNSLTAVDMVKVFSNPVADFNTIPSYPASVLSSVLFNDQSQGADHWLWNFGDLLNTSSILKYPTFAYSTAGSYTVTLAVSNLEGCKDTISHTIIIESEFTFYIPNAFTPDDDGLNDFFAPSGAEFVSFEMEIYNRWGEKLYHTTDIDKPWDGRAKGENEISKQDVYVYKIWVKDHKEEIHYYLGNVTLIN